MKFTDKIYYADDLIFDLIKAEFVFVESKLWYKLYKNLTDQSYWRLDEFEKYQPQFLVKIESLNGWENFNAEELQIDLLKRTRGKSEEKCKWTNCLNKALSNLAFCENHAYKEMGVRK